jgi:hypothetical protein
MAAQNPGQYESTLQNFNTAENIDPTTQFVNWLKQNSSPTSSGNFNTPTQSAILQEAYQLGIDPSQVNQLGLEQGIVPGNNEFQSLANNAKIASTLAGNSSDMYSLLSGTGDAQTQAKFNVLSGVLASTNAANYANADFKTLTNAGIDPATYAAVTGLTPSTAIAAYNNALNPQGAGDALAAQAGLAKGTQYQLGTNGFGQQVLTYTDPKTGQQMMYTPAVSRTDPGTSNTTYNMSSVGEYASVPTTGMQSNSLFNTVGNQTYTYGQNQYISPFNSSGQFNTTTASTSTPSTSATTSGIASLAGTNITQDQANQAAQAYADATKTGDYTKAQNLINQLGINAADVKSYFPNFNTSQMGSNLYLAGTPQAQQGFVKQLTSLASNPSSATSDQIQNLITQAQNDPTLSKTYATQIQTLQSALPTYQAQDAITQAQSGTNVLQNYQNLLNIAQSDPTVASALGSSTVSGIQSALQESGGGKYISTFEALTGLDKSLQSQTVAQLPATTQQVPVTDENGNPTGQTTTQTIIDPSKLPKGVYATDTGYEQQIQTPSGWDPGTKVYAQYDSTGKLTGYYSPNPVFPTDANGNMSKVKYDASWTASGAPTPQLDTSHGGFVSNTLQDLGPGAGLLVGAGIAALTGGIAAPLTDAISGALTDTLGMTAGTALTSGVANALSSGVITGGLTGLLGGSPAKGFDVGALGSGITSGLNAALPGANLPAAASNFTQPVGTALASSLVNKTPLASNLKNAAISGGLSTLLQNSGMSPKNAALAATVLPNIMAGKSLTPANLVAAMMAMEKMNSQKATA